MPPLRPVGYWGRIAKSSLSLLIELRVLENYGKNLENTAPRGEKSI